MGMSCREGDNQSFSVRVATDPKSGIYAPRRYRDSVGITLGIAQALANPELYKFSVPRATSTTSPLTKMRRWTSTFKKSVEGRATYSPCDICNSQGSGC